MILTKNCEITIQVKGSEAEYIAHLTALAIALKHTNDPDARASLADLLLAMLPNEEQLKLTVDG